MAKLKELREEKNMTQVELAEVFDISSDYISMMERGVRTPGFKLAKKIADYFESTVDEIFFNQQSNKTFAKVI